MGKDVIIACDFPSKAETLSFLELFKDERPFVKIGMELFYAEGPGIVKELKKRGHKVFLDLKLCDIPNTVERAMRVLSGLGADMVNLHAFGTKEMMKSAMAAFENMENRPIVIAVTQLTSTSEERMRNDLLIQKPIEEVVKHYALCASECGLDGVVCSPKEAALVKNTCGKAFMTVTPGIRFSSSSADDQVRVMTPETAKQTGCDYIVVGRPITKAENPLEAYRRCIKEFVD